MAEGNEPPRAAGERELVEELGLAVVAGRVLTLDWVGPHGPWDDLLVFVFDGGTLSASQASGVRISDPEIGAFAFVELAEAKRMLRPDVARRLARAHRALEAGSTDYLE
ncbi:NUDIX domain-containing protein [Actinoalloteichus spitiensis]|uniref:NUDIX domain-containing protein n=1 Tax=Actinoalloteichus spitiensis TaxID=252394 RepID=UPI001FDFC4B6|nr:NUDIX hydrolase [Actinoalloteichus spitiensis]